MERRFFCWHNMPQGTVDAITAGCRAESHEVCAFFFDTPKKLADVIHAVMTAQGSATRWCVVRNPSAVDTKTPRNGLLVEGADAAHKEILELFSASEYCVLEVLLTANEAEARRAFQVPAVFNDHAGYVVPRDGHFP